MHMFKGRAARARLKRERKIGGQAWATVGMRLTFRAEVMPGRESDERTYAVARVLTSGRVELVGLTGQHAETEFEPTR